MTSPPATFAQGPGDTPVRDVQAFLEGLARPLSDTETLPLAEALDRVLAAPLVSPLNVPPHPNAAMDGYAFDGAALAATGPLRLRCAGRVLAGQVWSGPVAQGEALRVMTGAALPEAVDTVVPQELVQLHEGGALVEIPAGAVRRGANRRLRGEDLQRGQVALPQGQWLGPAALGLAASLGVQHLDVCRRLRVAHFSTGDEIQSLGELPRAGAVYDSNRYTITAMLRRLGVEVIDLGVVPDDVARLRSAFSEAAARADVVISSGGVSAGEADHTRAMLHELCDASGGVVFWRVAMRPGRPLVVGHIGKAPNGQGGPALLFGLPGNPVAAMVSFLLFVRPTLRRMMGCAQAGPPPALRARLAHAIPSKRAGRSEYLRGTVHTDADGKLCASTTGQQGSGMLSSMVQAQGLIVLPHAQGPLQAGDPVDVMLFDGLI